MAYNILNMTQEIVSDKIITRDKKTEKDQSTKAMTISEIDELLTESNLILKMNRERLKKYSDEY